MRAEQRALQLDSPCSNLNLMRKTTLEWKSTTWMWWENNLNEKWQEVKEVARKSKEVWRMTKSWWEKSWLSEEIFSGRRWEWETKNLTLCRNVSVTCSVIFLCAVKRVQFNCRLNVERIQLTGVFVTGTWHVRINSGARSSRLLCTHGLTDSRRRRESIAVRIQLKAQSL